MSEEDRAQLERLIRKGQHSARVINRARVLLKTDEGWSASQVAAALDTSPRTVFRTKRRYVEKGLHGVLHDHPQANRYRKLDDRGETHLIALACSDAPEGHDHWTLRLLAEKVVELGLVESLSYETVRLRLKKHPQALAEAAVVHLPDERGVCGCNGGRAGSLRRALRLRASGGVL
ncbi:MAG: helix-turn-helix domain-containing protein [Chloroflexota bacterium]|nr:helix-turn-helix domain-containing protein [Chloroflexota bacterium]